MVLELHVFGPAFGLPSIDVECLAAILYIQKCDEYHPSSITNGWKLIADRNYGHNPFRRLPALYVRDGNGLWVAGYDEIVAYLKNSRIRKSNGETIDLDADLDEAQQARGIALSSFIRSRGLPLLDLSLYVSSENYNSCTRPAWSELLSWPESWVMPHANRERAQKRTEHFGLSALDVDVVRQQEEKKESQGIAAHIPKSMRKPRQTVSGLLGKSAQQTRFRLDAVTDDFLSVLRDELGHKTDREGEGLLDAGIHSVDCLAIAVLALMQASDLPQPWLQNALSTKYAALGSWATYHTRQISSQSTSQAFMPTESSPRSQLPWSQTGQRSIQDTSLAVIESIVSSVPVLRTAFTREEVDPSAYTAEYSPKAKQLVYARMRNRQVIYMHSLATLIASSTAVAWLVRAGILVFPRRGRSAARPRFGEAGILLGL